MEQYDPFIIRYKTGRKGNGCNQNKKAISRTASAVKNIFSLPESKIYSILVVGREKTTTHWTHCM